MPKHKIGDVVQLASGGPKMTVANPHTQKGYVAVQWFDQNETVQNAAFHEDMLVKSDAGAAAGPA